MTQRRCGRAVMMLRRRTPYPPAAMTPWEAGQTIVHQEVWLGRVWAARPLIVVEDEPDRLLLWIPEGTRRQVPMTPSARPDPPDLDDRIIANLELGDWEHRESVWDVSSLWILRPDDWHSLWVSWRDGRHYGWYVNLQMPFRRTPLGIEAMDLMLDVVAEPDLTWRWKDADQFDRIVAASIFDAEVAERVRAEAASAIRRIKAVEPPFSEPWPSWRPDPSWTIPVLPDGWDRPPA